MLRRVLFVDDDPLVLAGLRDALRRHRLRWGLRFTDDPHEALRVMEHDPAHVVVTDLRMPVIGGTPLLVLLEAWYPAAKRIVLSGHVDDLRADDRKRSDLVLSKPCDPETLASAIEAVTTAERAR